MAISHTCPERYICPEQSEGGLIASLPWFSGDRPGLTFVQRCPGLNQRCPGLTRCPGLEHYNKDQAMTIVCNYLFLITCSVIFLLSSISNQIQKRYGNQI